MKSIVDEVIKEHTSVKVKKEEPKDVFINVKEVMETLKTYIKSDHIILFKTVNAYYNKVQNELRNLNSMSVAKYIVDNKLNKTNIIALCKLIYNEQYPEKSDEMKVAEEVKPKKEKKVKIVKVVEDVKQPEVINTNSDIIPKEDVMPHKETLEYLFDTFGSLTKKMSKRFEQRITPLPQSSKQALHDQLAYKQNANDFHPTPQKCLNDHEKIRVDENTNILEPSAGFGSVLYYLLDKYPNVKITAY